MPEAVGIAVSVDVAVAEAEAVAVTVAVSLGYKFKNTCTASLNWCFCRIIKLVVALNFDLIRVYNKKYTLAQYYLVCI